MPVLASWPLAARVVAEVLDDLGTTGGETTANLKNELRFIRVRRIGGSDDGVTDVARVDVRVYDVDLGDAEDGAEIIRQRLISGPAATSHGVLDRARTEAGPIEVPGPDPENYRIVSATYRVSVRRR